MVTNDQMTMLVEQLFNRKKFKNVTKQDAMKLIHGERRPHFES